MQTAALPLPDNTLQVYRLVLGTVAKNQKHRERGK